MRETHKRAFARHLRQRMADAERLLWFYLRNHASAGDKFRRQAPVGPYIVDFLCSSQGLVVELDGGQHAKAIRYDIHRTAFLRAQGYELLRFWNNDVLLRLDAVMDRILAALTGPPVRGPPLFGDLLP